MSEMDHSSPNEAVITFRKAFMDKLELEVATGRKKETLFFRFDGVKNNLENIGVMKLKIIFRP